MRPKYQSGPDSVFLADDDADDRELFEDALREVASNKNLVLANDGMELMDILEDAVPPPPGVIFLDLNMPRKNGFECLSQIRDTEKLKDIPVVIFSTSSENQYIDRVYEQGADFYLCKPNNYPLLKKAISHIMNMDWGAVKGRSTRESFVLEYK